MVAPDVGGFLLAFQVPKVRSFQLSLRKAQVMETCTDLLAPESSDASYVKLQSGAGSLISCLPSLATSMGVAA